MLFGLSKEFKVQEKMTPSECMVKKYEELSWQQVCEVVKMCNAKKMFKQDQKKLGIAFSPFGEGPLWRKVLVEMLDQVATRKLGKAPTPHMERELQDWLETMQHSEGGARGSEQ